MKTDMFGKKKQPTPSATEEKKEKATPAYLRPDYPYKAVGEPITDLDSLDPDFIYEIKCNECEMSIRSLGVNIKSTYERLKESGCIGCGNKDLIVRQVNMSAGSGVSSANG